MKYHGRHEKRDIQLPNVRKDLLESIVNSLKTDPDILAIFVGGSIAKGNEDVFSDIDLRIVVSNDKYKDFIKRKQQIPLEWGNLLFFEDMNPSAPYAIAHFDNFIKVDVFFYIPEGLQSSIWYKNLKALYDPKGIVQELVEQSNEITYKATAKEVERWRGKIFSYIHEVYRRVHREEYYYALTMVNNLRSFIVNGWNMEVDRHSNDGWDWSKIEGQRSELEPWQLSLLESWSCGRNQNEIMKTLMRMIPEIIRLHNVLCQKTGLEEKRNTLNKVIDLVM
jgi:predicted nucleotidyltransferase